MVTDTSLFSPAKFSIACKLFMKIKINIDHLLSITLWINVLALYVLAWLAVSVYQPYIYIITENTPAVQLQKILCVHICLCLTQIHISNLYIYTLEATAGSVTNQNLLSLDSTVFWIGIITIGTHLTSSPDFSLPCNPTRLEKSCASSLTFSTLSSPILSLLLADQQNSAEGIVMV